MSCSYFRAQSPVDLFRAQKHEQAGITAENCDDLPPLGSCHIIKVSQAVASPHRLRAPAARQEPRRHRREAGFKPALRRDLVSPQNLPFSLTHSSLALFPLPFSSYTFIPRLSPCPPTTIMDLTARCLFLLPCLGVILAIDLEAIDPGYYVEPTATSEAIDYKDPCKAGEYFPLFFVAQRNSPYLCECRNMPRILQPRARIWRDDSSRCSFEKP